MPNSYKYGLFLPMCTYVTFRNALFLRTYIGTRARTRVHSAATPCIISAFFIRVFISGSLSLNISVDVPSARASHRSRTIDRSQEQLTHRPCAGGISHPRSDRAQWQLEFQHIFCFVSFFLGIETRVGPPLTIHLADIIAIDFTGKFLRIFRDARGE